jgi:hypothetical protein
MGDPLTPAELTAIEARASAATSGPWSVAENKYRDYAVAIPEPRFAAMWIVQGVYECDDPYDDCQGNVLRALRDAEFIAHAREDVPRLVAEVRRLRAALHEQGQ